MATLQETLRSDMIKQMKAGNKLATTTLRNMLGAITSAEKSGKVEQHFDDTQVQQVLTRELKKREATAQEYTDAAAKIGASLAGIVQPSEQFERESARFMQLLGKAAQEQDEARIIEAYLPQQLSEAEVAALVDSAVAAVENPTQKDFGAIMKNVIAASQGRADGKVVSTLVRQRLTA